MHFTTYVIYPDMELTEENKESFREMVKATFNDNYCYNCGETEASVENYCDWFTLGGRWLNTFYAKKGVKGHFAYTISDDEKRLERRLQADKKHFDIVNIKDIINLKRVSKPYAIVINGENVVRCEDYDENWKSHKNPEFTKLFNAFRNGKIKGVVAQIDCHD